jgi:hypothetical protein
MFYVAYNAYGDCIADGVTMDELLLNVEQAGYFADEILIGRVTP